MATSMTRLSHGDLWHRSIDDLLGPSTETFRLGGPGPFVINLRASSTSMSPTPSVPPGFEHLQLFQIQRIEDDVLRFRLRLGPFTSEEVADAVLLKVRDSYPCALTATATADDLQAIELVKKPKAQVLKPIALRAAIPAAEAVATAAATPPVTSAVATHAAAPPATPAVATAAAASPAKPAVATHAAAPPTTPIAATSATADASKRVPAPPQVALSSAYRENQVDSPQLARRLTPAELNAETLRWFVIELALTDHAIDPETVPNLDIYDLYRLYSVTEQKQGRCMHALRLGFFGEEMAAKAVASYLAAYYEKPTIKRVSVAERQRFSEQGIEARKDVGATGMHAAIEITADRLARPVRKSVTPPP